MQRRTSRSAPVCGMGCPPIRRTISKISMRRFPNVIATVVGYCVCVAVSTWCLVLLQVQWVGDVVDAASDLAISAGLWHGLSSDPPNNSPLKALTQWGEVWVVAGDARQRRRQIQVVMNAIRAGTRFEFCYSESSTMPTTLTEPHHLPTHPLEGWVGR
jgi:hypothetical protein